MDHSPKERLFTFAAFMKTFLFILPLSVSFYSFAFSLFIEQLFSACHVLRTAVDTRDLTINKENPHLMELTGHWER